MKEFKNLLVLCAFVFVNIFALSAATEVATIAEAKEMGYRKIITYILATEPGTSLKASGWTLEDGNCGGATWENCTRTKERPVQLSMIEQKQKYPVGIPKQRWSKEL